MSLDGFIAGPGGEIDWSAPDEELHRFHNEQVREVGAHLCGRRLYEMMLYWETADEGPSASEDELEFARIWKALPKIVFSTTLERVEGNARLARDGVAEEVATLKEQPGKDLAVGGAGLASTCIELGLVDEYRLFVNPVVLGGGTPYFPALERGSTSSSSRRGRSARASSTSATGARPRPGRSAILAPRCPGRTWPPRNGSTSRATAVTWTPCWRSAVRTSSGILTWRRSAANPYGASTESAST